jgi:hypothetical protein
MAAPHVSDRDRTYETAAHRVLILGAGFGGLGVALGLERRLGNREDSSVLVVDRDSALLFTPLLWTVADGRADPSDVVVPVRAFQRGRRFHLLHAEVLGIDLERQEVQTSAGVRPYDVLVIALGSVTAVPDLPGLREHARVFHSPIDALELRNHLIDAVEAAHQTEDLDERRAWLTFVVGVGVTPGSNWRRRFAHTWQRAAGVLPMVDRGTTEDRRGRPRRPAGADERPGDLGGSAPRIGAGRHRGVNRGDDRGSVRADRAHLAR